MPSQLMRAGLAGLLLCGAISAQIPPMFEPGTAMNLGSPAGSDDFSPTLNVDETYMVFSSNRPGGLGGYDLYETQRPSVGAPFAPPQLLVSLNSSANEWEPSLVRIGPNQFELYFVSTRPGGPSGSSIYVSQGQPGNWGPPQLVPGGPNQPGWLNDDPYITDDRLTMFFTSNGGGTAAGGADIYVSRRPAIGASWGPPAPFAPANSAAFDHSPVPESNGNIVFFSSTRAGGGGGQSDLWVTSLDNNTGQWTAPIAITELNTPNWESNMWRSGLTGRIYVSRFIPGGGRIFCDCWRVTFLFIRECIVSFVVPKILWLPPFWPQIIWCRFWIWRINTIIIFEWYDWWNTGGLLGTLLSFNVAGPIPTGLPEAGTLALPPSLLFTHSFTLLSPEGRSTSQLALPNNPALAGTPIAVQGVLFNPAPAPGMPTLVWSEPGRAVIQP